VEHVTKIVNEYNDIVGKLTTAEVRVSVVSDDEKKLRRMDDEMRKRVFDVRDAFVLDFHSPLLDC
jgi:hypothetical protein